MGRTLICYAPSSRAYVRWLELGRPDGAPKDVPFYMPDETRKGDRYLLYVGGQDQCFVGTGMATSNWNRGVGDWKGHGCVFTKNERIFREPIPSDHVFAATGFRPPRWEGVVDEDIAAQVWRVATGKKYSQVDRAVEGFLTESRSKSRNPGLRAAALARAKGRCECCGIRYSNRANGLGKSCLVVHHKKQLKDTDQPVETRLSDLAVVCANCHMMIHSNPAKALTISQLRNRLVR